MLAEIICANRLTVHIAPGQTPYCKSPPMPPKWRSAVGIDPMDPRLPTSRSAGRSHDKESWPTQDDYPSRR